MSVNQLRGYSLPLLSDADWLNRMERGRAEGLKTAVVAGAFNVMNLQEQDLLRLVNHLCNLVGVIVIEDIPGQRRAAINNGHFRASRVAALRSVHCVVLVPTLSAAEELRSAFLPELFVHCVGLAP